MKSLKFSSNTKRNIWIIVISLFILVIVAISCGKLQEGEQPTGPIGTTGGVKFPPDKTDQKGTFKLSITADSSSIPADGITFTTLHGRIEDSSGGPLQNFLITFNTAPTSDTICRFLVPGALPGDSGSFSTSTNGLTDAGGSVSVRLYGVQAGSCVVQATTDVDGDGADDLYTTIGISVTSAPGVPGSGIPGIFITSATCPAATGTMDPTTGEFELDTATITARVWDETGKPAGAGIRVELYVDGVLEDYQQTDSSGNVSFSYTPAPIAKSETYKFVLKVIINGIEYLETRTCIVNLYIPDKVTVDAPNLTLTMPATGDATGTLNVVATVTSGGQPLSNTTVSFAITPGTGCAGIVSLSPTSGTATTNVAGQAQLSVSVTASATTAPSCQYTATASVGGSVAPGTDTGTVTVN